MPEFFDKYLVLQSDIDALCKRLYSIHSSNMECKEGCDSCCMNFGLLQIEFDYIKEALETEEFAINKNIKENECPFLVNKLCTIYKYRPIICRTHGFPLLQMGESEWELSVCDLNFKDVADDYFNEENCYPQDLYNSKLFLLNRKYLKSVKKNTDNPSLTPLSDLIKD